MFAAFDNLILAKCYFLYIRITGDSSYLSIMGLFYPLVLEAGSYSGCHYEHCHDNRVEGYACRTKKSAQWDQVQKDVFTDLGRA